MPERVDAGHQERARDDERDRGHAYHPQRVTVIAKPGSARHGLVRPHILRQEPDHHEGGDPPGADDRERTHRAEDVPGGSAEHRRDQVSRGRDEAEPPHQPGIVAVDPPHMGLRRHPHHRLREAGQELQDDQHRDGGQRGVERKQHRRRDRRRGGDPVDPEPVHQRAARNGEHHRKRRAGAQHKTDHERRRADLERPERHRDRHHGDEAEAEEADRENRGVRAGNPQGGAQPGLSTAPSNNRRCTGNSAISKRSAKRPQSPLGAFSMTTTAVTPSRIRYQVP